MNGYKEISVNELDMNIFSAVNDEWMLVTAKNSSGEINTMTASWGGFGIMWNKPVCVAVIRPQRHTFKFAEDSQMLTLSFLEDGNREALKICGTRSGRDCDKISEAGLTPIHGDGWSAFAEAKTVFVGRIIYKDFVKEDGFIDKSIIDSKYPARDYHKAYVCEIEKVFIKE